MSLNIDMNKFFLQIVVDFFVEFPDFFGSFRESPTVWILGNIPLELNWLYIHFRITLCTHCFGGSLGVQLSTSCPLLNDHTSSPDIELNLSRRVLLLPSKLVTLSWSKVDLIHGEMSIQSGDFQNLGIQIQDQLLRDFAQVVRIEVGVSARHQIVIVTRPKISLLT